MEIPGCPWVIYLAVLVHKPLSTLIGNGFFIFIIKFQKVKYEYCCK